LKNVLTTGDKIRDAGTFHSQVQYEERRGWGKEKVGQKNKDYRTERKREGLWVIKEMEQAIKKGNNTLFIWYKDRNNCVMATEVKVSNYSATL